MNIKMFFALVAASAVSLTSIVVSAGAAQTPFKGTVSAVETAVVVPPTASLTRDGTGTATYLGKYTEHIVMTVDLPTMSSTGAATFTAANGDTLTATVVGQATRTGPTKPPRSASTMTGAVRRYQVGAEPAFATTITDAQSTPVAMALGRGDCSSSQPAI